MHKQSSISNKRKLKHPQKNLILLTLGNNTVANNLYWMYGIYLYLIFIVMSSLKK